jgi:hypothetical protein
LFFFSFFSWFFSTLIAILFVLPTCIKPVFVSSNQKGFYLKPDLKSASNSRVFLFFSCRGKQVVRDVADLVNLRARLDEWHRGQVQGGDRSGQVDESGAGAAAVARWSGWGERSVGNLLAAVDEVAATPLPAHRLLYTLGVSVRAAAL